ncbi:hypothetical protein PR048_019677 [Dryococelus australis]|uniref:Reverse transcriptase RNase H-like domain-containing protein n=1 Tax=Dryococelus australis TaxID=614101 RepID=A0ABQ9H457_9NEOP|nr:hypothetical protein PR048_019677 [Dryococelus australis]
MDGESRESIWSDQICYFPSSGFNFTRLYQTVFPTGRCFLNCLRGRFITRSSPGMCVWEAEKFATYLEHSELNLFTDNQVLAWLYSHPKHIGKIDR